MEHSEIFTIAARRCKRCGGLLTSSEAIKNGYGSCCLRKMKQEEAQKEALKDQLTLFPADDVKEDK